MKINSSFLKFLSIGGLVILIAYSASYSLFRKSIFYQDEIWQERALKKIAQTEMEDKDRSSIEEELRKGLDLLPSQVFGISFPSKGQLRVEFYDLNISSCVILSRAFFGNKSDRTSVHHNQNQNRNYITSQQKGRFFKASNFDEAFYVCHELYRFYEEGIKPAPLAFHLVK